MGRLCGETGISPTAGSILITRYRGNLDAALSFFGEDVSEEGILVPGLNDCVCRLLEAKKAGEKVAIYSDFDVDGVTAAAILKEAFCRAGIDCLVYIPDRHNEGYGFHPHSLELLISQGVSLFVTADCGITGHEACEKAMALGAHVLITDHHLPPEILPQAFCILDPFLSSWDGLRLKNLTGAGVAYILAAALLRAANIKVQPGWAHDLLTLSIAGDSLPVLGFNRRWVKSGLEVLNDGQRPGIEALCEVAGISAGSTPKKRLSFDRDVVFGLVPRLNAAGRMLDANLSYELLVERDSGKCLELAKTIHELNQKRRAVEDTIVAQSKECVAVEQYAVCAWDPNWHPGVIGIACSKLREMSQRPVALAAGTGDVLKGSIRGVHGFHAHKALSQCRDLLLGFGGHEFAAGFTVKKPLVQQFFRKFTEKAEIMLKDTDLTPVLNIDSVVDLSELHDDYLRQLMSLEPFGQGNPVPVVASMGSKIGGMRFMGKNQTHLQLTLAKGDHEKRFIWFGKGELARSLAILGQADVAFVPYRNVFLGREQTSLLIKDIRPAREITGYMYSDIFCHTPLKRPLIIYTWSADAAAALKNSAERRGIAAVIHTGTDTGALAHNARLALEKPGGVVISTSPWTLPKSTGLRPAFLVVHPPVKIRDTENLQKMLSGAKSRFVYPLWEQDSRMWRDFQYPSKGCVEHLWKYLVTCFPEKRFPLWELGKRWEDVLDVPCFGKAFAAKSECWEGSQRVLRSAINIFGDLGLIGYTQNRRQPELVLNQASGKISLSASPLFEEGQALRNSWHGLCETFLDGDLSLWRL